MSGCVLYLDNNTGTYYPGNTVIGRVVCTFSKSKNIRGIKLKLRGKEHNDWTEEESYYDSDAKETKSRTVYYTGNNTFLTAESLLLGSGDIGAGQHVYPFELSLPKSIPGSYQGKYGGIKYVVKATVDRPFKFDYEDEKMLHVVSLIDFNEIPNLQLSPVQYQEEKMLCCCCCASGPITMNLFLEKEAFVQGEVAKVKIELSNLSNESIERVEVKLIMTIKSKVTSPSTDSRYDIELLASDRDSGVGAHGEKTYKFDLEIPQLAVIPNFNMSTLFEQWCNLKIKAVILGWHSNLVLETGIKMGHIPVRGATQNNSTQQNSYLPPSYNSALDGIPYPPQSNHAGINSLPYLQDSGVDDTSLLIPSGQIGFVVPQQGIGAAPNAPPLDSAPSAPPKAEIAAGNFGDGNANGQGEAPPPPYDEALQAPSASYPPTQK